jgi:hypothetical protein
VTKQLRTVEKTGVSFDTKRKSRISGKKLADLLPSVIDETMKQVFREKSAQVISNYIGNNCHLKQEEIVEKSDAFSAGLERLLGSGAAVIEILILKNLYRRLELKFKEKKGHKFPDYINELKKKFG